MGLFGKLFGGDEVDPSQVVICDLIDKAVSKVATSSVLRQRTRMTGAFAIPHGQQYLAGTFLNVLCFYARHKRIPRTKFNENGLLDLLCRRIGKDCRAGFDQTQDIGDTMRSNGAPLPDSVPEAAQSIVAEFCIAKILFQNLLPEEEYDIFSRVYFEAVKEMCSKLGEASPVEKFVHSAPRPRESSPVEKFIHSAPRPRDAAPVKKFIHSAPRPRDAAPVKRFIMHSKTTAKNSAMRSQLLPVDTDVLLSFARSVMENAEELCDRLRKTGSVTFDYMKGEEAIEVIVAAYLYVITRLLSKWHGDIWHQVGEDSLNKIVSFISMKYPKLELMYARALSENSSEVEQPTLNGFGEFMASEPGEVRDRSSYVACGVTWWRGEMSRGVQVGFCDNDNWFYNHSAYALYADCLKMLGVKESPCLSMPHL